MTECVNLDEYRTELRRQVCERCIARQRGAPPCEPRGVRCGVEAHLERLIDVCRSVDSPLIDPYLDRLHSEICADCAYRDGSGCPCPLRYLLPLAVAAVETVELRRSMVGAAAQ
jgi:hypothetical protein